MNIIGIIREKRNLIVLGILIGISLNIIYMAMIFFMNKKVLSSIEDLSVSMINKNLSDNHLPQISDEDKMDLEYKLKAIEDDIFILLVKVRKANLDPRDYFFLVKRKSVFHLFDTDIQYHVVLLDLQTSPDIKYRFTENY